MRKLYLLFSLILILFSSCIFDVHEDFRFDFTAENNGAGWKIYVYSQGKPDFSSCLEPDAETDGQILLLNFEHNAPTPVIAQNLKTGQKLGAIYPYSHQLTSSGAFCADVLFRIYLQTYNADYEQIKENIRYFNWAKLLETCEKIQDLEQTDPGYIASRIVQGKFRKNDLHAK